jgi:hypothetical protein
MPASKHTSPVSLSGSSAPKSGVASSSEAPKKETAKITLPPAAKVPPQATVNLKPPTPVKPSGKPDAAIAVAPSDAQTDPDLILKIAAAVVALLSVGVQVWTFLS